MRCSVQCVHCDVYCTWGSHPTLRAAYCDMSVVVDVVSQAARREQLDVASTTPPEYTTLRTLGLTPLTDRNTDFIRLNLDNLFGCDALGVERTCGND